MTSIEETVEPVPSGWQKYLKIGIRHRWWLVISAVSFWAGVLALSLIVPPKYKSETIVLIGQEGAPAQYVAPNSGDLQQRLQSLSEQTLSRSRLAQLIQEFHLYGDTQGETVSDETVKQMRDDIGIELIRSTTGGNVSAFKISYSAPSAEKAQKVTADLASLFMRDSLGAHQRQAEQTTSFLESQLEDARKDLEKQGGLLHDFKTRNLGELPEQSASNAQILIGLQAHLQSAKNSLDQAEKQKLYLGSLLGWSVAPNSSSAAVGDTSALAASSEDEQIERMKADLTSLSGRYTQRYPDVVHLKEQIANTERLKSQEQSGPGLGKSVSSSVAADQLLNQRAASKVGQLQSEFQANELEIRNRKNEIKELESQISLYQARLNLTPVREQEFAEVTRNDEQSRARYESLLAKMQQSQMVSALLRTQQSQIFQEVEPPTRPLRPYWPNRLKFSVVGLLLGAFVGLFTVLVKETADARIYSEEDLRCLVAMPVIATIPPLTTGAEKRRKKQWLAVEITLASLLAALVPALTLVVYWKS